MKFRYEFSNGDVEEIEVSGEWYDALVALDAEEKRNERRETRRHTSLNNGHADGEWLAFDPEVDDLLYSKETSTRVRAVVELLKPRQHELIYALYLSDKPLSQREYAERLGVAEESVKQSAWRARIALKKLLEKA